MEQKKTNNYSKGKHCPKCGNSMANRSEQCLTCRRGKLFDHEKRMNNKTYVCIHNKWYRKDHISQEKTCLSCGVLICNHATYCSDCKGILLNGRKYSPKSEETRKKLSIAAKGMRRSPTTEFKKGLVPWNKGLTKHNDSRIKKISELQTGRKVSDETIQKLKESHKDQNKGKTYDDIYGDKADYMRKIRQGTNHPFYGKKHTEQTKKLISASRTGQCVGKEHHLYGTHPSKETVKKQRESHLGKRLSKEQRNKISKSLIGKMAGEKCHFWKGGISFDPYTLDFTNVFRESIRERDNRCCVLCNQLEEDDARKLSVHHVDYDKTNSFPQNCVSLCRVCHSLTNGKRAHWKTFFQGLLKERYGYEYTQDQKIILDFGKEDW